MCAFPERRRLSDVGKDKVGLRPGFAIADGAAAHSWHGVPFFILAPFEMEGEFRCDGTPRVSPPNWPSRGERPNRI